MYFDIYFSHIHGLEIDFPFVNLLLPSSVVYFALIAVVALRVRKVYFLDKRRGR